MNKNLINKESYIESRLEDIYGRKNIEVLFLAFLKYGIRVIGNLKIDLPGKNNVDEIWTFNDVVVDFVNYKDTVKDRVWGKDAVLCDRAIDVYISA